MNAMLTMLPGPKTCDVCMDTANLILGPDCCMSSTVPWSSEWWSWAKVRELPNYQIYASNTEIIQTGLQCAISSEW